MIAGSITVVADSRLNRLIAQGTARDIEQIESYLSIIDKDTGITSVEVYGRTHVIELLHTKATEVAAVIRDAFGDRVSGATGRGQPNQPGSPQADREAIAAKIVAMAKQQGSEKKTGKNGPAGGQSRDLEPRMTVAVHEPSNSLIVTAPDQLFEEVEQLVKLVDARSEESVEVITIRDSESYRSVLQQFLSGSATGSSSRSATPPRPPSSPSRPPSSPQSKIGR